MPTKPSAASTGEVKMTETQAITGLAANTQAGSVPAGIQSKLLGVITGLPSLKKDSHNDEGWNFVSIDVYYEKVGKELGKAGLGWKIDEQSFGYNSDSGVCLATYKFFLYDEYQCLDWGKLSLVHPYEGATTCGKMVSYAEKIFMRALVKAVTGEAGADTEATAKTVKPKAKTTPVAERIIKGMEQAVAHAKGELPDVRVVQGGSLIDTKEILEAIDASKDTDTLTGVWTQYQSVIDQMPETMLLPVRAAFIKRKKELQ